MPSQITGVMVGIDVSIVKGFKRLELAAFNQGEKELRVVFYNQIVRIILFEGIEGVGVCRNNLLKLARLECFRILLH